MTPMIKGFKDFVMRGNVIDLAVAVVVGAAFAALIGAFTEAFINPLVGLALGGGVDAGQWEINGQVIDFTLMVNAIITFVVTLAVIYFIFVVPMNKYRERLEANAAAEEAEPSKEELLLTEIRDLLANRTP